MVTAVGHDAHATAASVAAGIAAMRLLRLPDRGGNPLTGCPAFRCESPYLYARHLRYLAARAVREALESAGVSADGVIDAHVFWIAPECARPGYSAFAHAEHQRAFLGRLGLAVERTRWHDLAGGSAAAFDAVREAGTVLQAFPQALCLICSADSLIQLRLLRHLQRQDRLKTEIYADGLIPGEAAACVVVERAEAAKSRGAPALCHIAAVGCGDEPCPIAASGGLRAEGLTRTLRAVLEAHGEAHPTLTHVYGDLNGESYRAREWALASMRVLDTSHAQLHHPADCLGDVGAASGVLLVGLAAIQMQDEPADDHVLVFAGSDSGRRGAVWLVPGEALGARPTTTARNGDSSEYRDLLGLHADEIGFLWRMREERARSARFGLNELARWDARLRAHSRALAVHVAEGWRALRTAELPIDAAMFAAIGLALRKDAGAGWAEALLAVGDSDSTAVGGLVAGLGFATPGDLAQGIGRFLASDSDFLRYLGTETCARHRRDPGVVLERFLQSGDARLRESALRCAGAVGRVDLLAPCQRRLDDPEPGCRFRAAWSAVLLGDRGDAMYTLGQFARAPGPYREQAIALYLRSADLQTAYALLQSLAKDAAKNMRLLLQGAGIVGDPHYAPWLIKQMEYPEVTRLAGESLSFITGLDLSYLNLDRPLPEGVEFGPNDDPEDENVAMDPDDSLPWPDVAKIQAWWQANGQRFQPGTRYFMGEPLSIDHCRRVLREGFQRQRTAAALHLSLLQPGTPLFPTAAPAWRQQRWLGTKS